MNGGEVKYVADLRENNTSWIQRRYRAIGPRTFALILNESE